MILQLLDLPFSENALKGLKLELEDGAYPVIEEIITTLDQVAAFKDADFAILVGAKPRLKGMERSDLLLENANIFVSQGKIINEVAKKSVKVIVVGNPCNTNALLCQKAAPSIPKENFTALTRLD